MVGSSSTSRIRGGCSPRSPGASPEPDASRACSTNHSVQADDAGTTPPVRSLHDGYARRYLAAASASTSTQISANSTNRVPRVPIPRAGYARRGATASENLPSPGGAQSSCTSTRRAPSPRRSCSKARSRSPRPIRSATIRSTGSRPASASSARCGKSRAGMQEP